MCVPCIELVMQAPREQYANQVRRKECAHNVFSCGSKAIEARETKLCYDPCKRNETGWTALTGTTERAWSYFASTPSSGEPRPSFLSDPCPSPESKKRQDASVADEQSCR